MQTLHLQDKCILIFLNNRSCLPDENLRKDHDVQCLKGVAVVESANSHFEVKSKLLVQ